MDGEANLPAPIVPPESGPTRCSLIRPIDPDSNLSRSFNSTSSSSSSSPPALVRQLQAAFKHHRPLGMMQLNNIRPRRTFVPQRQISKSSASKLGPTFDLDKYQDEVFGGQSHGVGDFIAQSVNEVPGVNEDQIDASITPPSMSGTITNTFGESVKASDIQRDQSIFFADNKSNSAATSLLVDSQHVPLVGELGGQKKVQFSLGNNARSHGMEWDPSNQPDAVTSISHDLKHYNGDNIEADKVMQSYGADSSLVGKRTMELQGQLFEIRKSLQKDMSQPMTQSAVVGSSCASTTLVNSISAPMLSLMTYCSQPHQNSQSNMAKESLGDCNANFPSTTGHMVQPACTSSKSTGETLVDQRAIEAQENETKENDTVKDASCIDDKSNQRKGLANGDASDLHSCASLSINAPSDMKLVTSKSEKDEKNASGKHEKDASGKAANRKRSYNPDLFFKVNGKLYQRLGKIGSGGSSEVHKVISSDCTIYALKKIKLRGRDYATAYGFCQEIEYLNKLKGKNHIIQLIDYEVTDKILLQEVMNGCMSNKDGRVKEDGFIYMVLEYGEIDLAQMLSQKWKEIDGSDSTIDENWLRFYWQQILLAVNTIHEERIVHSDLKPANFLLVRGSLKLIDFGIAKAIMSDTTNIQRDSQVGTLSYMSPEAFMCNETDANGNTIKCGRPSDIWSLGCILYQMVYGRTPFSEYKTFWAKFKVITDPNHEIVYEPMSNPWLLDLMKKCLAWDRNERWRIPQLLQHPFLVPPIPPLLSSCEDQSCKLLQLITESCGNNHKALMLCAQMQELLIDPPQAMKSQELISRDQQRKLLREISSICCELQEQLAD